MRTIKVLVVEDNPAMPGFLIAKLESNARFETELKTNPPDAVNRARQVRFDIVFIDLELSREIGLYEGIGVGEQIRNLQPEATIVMYSTHIEPGEASAFERYQDCIQAGADAVFARKEIFPITAAELGRRIDELLEKKQSSLRGGHHVEFAKDKRTLAARDSFGGDSLEGILVASSPTTRYLRVEALEAGYSGAAVVRVHGSAFANFSAPVELIVKVSKSRFALEDELQRRPLPGSGAWSASATPHHDKVISSHGLFALAIPEVKGRVALRTFLLDEPSESTTARVCRRVFAELLLPNVVGSQPWGAFGLDSSSYQLRPSAIVQIWQFLEDASRWRIINPDDRRAVVASLGLLDRIANGYWTFDATRQHAALLHGDFHTRNVFVSSTASSVVIDFGRSEVYPRLFDFAALDIDLLLAVADANQGNCHKFEKVGRWSKEAMSCFPFVDKPKTSNMRCSALNFRRILVDLMSKKVEDLSEAEYRESLLFQCFRYLRFPSISLPKKIVACHVIERLAALIGISA